ncbi:MAG: mechanosensitive ion channel [Pacificimonas sp.]
MSLAAEWGPRILAAIAILIVAWIVAKAVKWGLSALVDRISYLKRHQSSVTSGTTLGEQLGTLAYWIVLLVGVVAALQPLGLSQVVAPINEMTTSIFAYLPRIIGAAIVFFIGLVLARIVKQVIVTAMATFKADEWAAKAGVTDVAAKDLNLGRVLGTIAFVLIIIPISIMALNILDIPAITEPATRMLDVVLQAVPRVIAAGIILAIAYFIGKWASTITETLLAATGVDNAVASLGAFPATMRTSRAAGVVVMTAILLFGAIMATQQLGFPAITALLTQVIELGGQVLFGSAIILIGVMLANVLANAVSRSTGETNFAPAIVKYATIALAVAMGLRFMGLANDIVNLAFALILGSAAVAAALAFGLGGREPARRLLDRLMDENEAKLKTPKAKTKTPPPPPPAA